MARFERMRDVVSGASSLEALERERRAAGWQLVSIEWRRELPADEAPREGSFDEDIPYGLRISDDCSRLEVDLKENQVLLEMMQRLVEDFSFSAIAGSLNEKGFRTRAGKVWSQVTVFEMLPRLIEVGPRMFSTDEWTARRRKLSKMV